MPSGSHWYGYNSLKFSDVVPAGHQIVKMASLAKGAFGCSWGAEAEVVLNGFTIGEHGSSGSCR